MDLKLIKKNDLNEGKYLRSAFSDLPEVGVVLEGGRGDVAALELEADDLDEL